MGEVAPGAGSLRESQINCVVRLKFAIHEYVEFETYNGTYLRYRLLGQATDPIEKHSKVGINVTP